MTEHLIIHDDCGLPIELCVCPNATWKQVDCRCMKMIQYEKGWVCPICLGHGHYFVATGDTHPKEIK